MPQKTIFFDDANVVLDHVVQLEEGARYIGAEILCFGRCASGETFRRGSVRQRTQVRSAGRLVWWEPRAIDAEALRSRFGLHGASVCATLIGMGALAPAALLGAAMAFIREHGLLEAVY